MKANGRKRDKMGKMRKSVFHNWAINLSDEEIKIISDSGGMIGLMMDKGLLGSHQNVLGINALSDALARKEAFLELVAQNIFQAVQAVGHKGGWDVLALGSDYDGMITHLDPYHEASRFPDFQRDLIDFLKRRRYGQDLWYGQQPEEMVQKLLQTNALTFLENHFN